MLAGVHRVVPVTRRFLSGDLFGRGSLAMAHQHDA